MAFSIDWNAVGAIATTLATLVALYLGLRRPRRKLLLEADFQLPHTKIVAKNTGEATITIDRAFSLRSTDLEAVPIQIPPLARLESGDKIELNPYTLQEPLAFKNLIELYCVDTIGKRWDLHVSQIARVTDALKGVYPDLESLGRKPSLFANIIGNFFVTTRRPTKKPRNYTVLAFLGMMATGGMMFALTALLAGPFVGLLGELNANRSVGLFVWLQFSGLAFAVGGTWLFAYMIFKALERYILDQVRLK